MKTKKTTHPAFVRLLNNIVNEIPIKKSGTYNNADPTHYEKGFKDFVYKRSTYRVEFWDCTWGVEVTISKLKFFPESTAVWHEKEIASFYISRERRYDPATERWENYEEIIFRQDGYRGMIKILGTVFSYTFKPDFVSLQEELWNSEMECDPYLMHEYV